MDGCGNCMKYSFGFITLLIFIGGGALLGIGISSLVQDGSQVEHLISIELYQGTAILIIVAGSLIVLVSFLGCCGAFQESKCLLGTFFCLVFIMFVLTGAAIVTGFVVGSDSILDSVETELRESIQYYKSKEAVKDAWDALQKAFECCGVDGPEDWPDVPDSCYKEGSKKPFDKGCLHDVRDFIDSNGKLMGGIGIGVLVLLLLSMIFSCAIMKSIH
ncbi:tetraspanin-9-like [Pollicipes pollicipes]|uniref:tetraspanin-9-like n=1 Tax=Pollicipes pollicipes TaxID=41117 RepID=UPI001884B170|nr:tetraspanin-9-like [Pollicipes pollicipes]